MGEWIETTIGEQINLKRGFDIAKRDHRDGNIPVISSGGIHGYHDTAKAVGPGVLTGRKGTLGKVYYVETDYWAHSTTLWVENFKGNYPRFVYYFLQTLDLLKMDVGSSNPTLNRNHVHPIKVYWAPLEEQRAIAHILGSLDDKIEANRRMNETLENTARAIFKSWFVDFDPVHAKANGDIPEGMSAETADLFPDAFQESELGLIPRGWEVGVLEDAIEIHDKIRIPLSRRQREKRQGEYRYYGATSVMDYIDDYLFDGIYILMAEDGSVRDDNDNPILQYVWGQFWVNNHAHVLTGKNGISNEHLLLALQNIRVTPYVTGAVQLKISQTNMKRMPFTFATASIHTHFTAIIEPLFAKIRQAHDENRTLAELRDTLLPRLISGELRVEDVGQFMGDV